MRSPGPLTRATDVEATNKWHRDVLPECHYSDKIWGYAVRTSEYLRGVPAPRDFVLHRMMEIGVEDWDSPNRIRAEDQEVLRLATSMIARVTEKIYLLEDRVRGTSSDLSSVG